MRKLIAILILTTPLAACTAAPPALIPAEACVVIDAAGTYVCGEPGTLPEPWPTCTLPDSSTALEGGNECAAG